MRTIRKISGYLLMTVFCALVTVIPARAAEEDKVQGKVYVDEIALEGKNQAEARRLVEDYAGSLETTAITLIAAGGNEVVITPADIGFTWSNPEVIEEAFSLGRKGNVVQRYKAIKDLENNGKVFPLEFSLDTALITDVITEQCEEFNVPAVNATMLRTDGRINVTEGQTGRQVNTSASVDLIYNYLQEQWDKKACRIELVVDIQEPKGSTEELRKLTDVLGSYTTSYSTSGKSRTANVDNGCALINGSCIYPGEEFTTYETVAPFTTANGYFMAGSYLNGQVVDSLGGGICQVSTTLYNAVLLAELEVTERHNHSMIVTYVKPSMDAAIAESAGKDFKFINNTDHPIYIEGITTPDKQITFTIYGVENRPASRTVEYVSEVLETRVPDTEVIYQNAGFPVGYISVQSAHIGYRAQLWKVITENGVQTSKEVINSSSYMASPRSATVGIASEDPVALAEISAAIATNSIDHIKNVAAALQGLPVAPDLLESGVPVPPEQQVPAAGPENPAQQVPAAGPEVPAPEPIPPEEVTG